MPLRSAGDGCEVHRLHEVESMNDRIDLSELKRNTDLVALLESYGVALKKRGAEYDGLCIAHTETNPSMQVYVKDGVQKWHCKACGAGGTVIDAIMVLDGCDEITAIKRLQKNGFHRETRMTTTKQIAPKLNNWMHRVAPDEMPDMTTKDYGAPVATWRYNSETGECLGYIARYATPDGGKSYRPWTFGAYSENVAAVWKPKTWTAGRRPLYGLDELAKRPDAKVCIVEGEKAADAARKLLGAMVCITWPGGANGIQSVDWSPLANRDILLIPDADKTGVGYDCMIKVAGILLAIGCKVRILDTSDQPDAWDLADALAEGWTAQQLGEWAKPRIKPYDHPKDTDIQTQVVVPQAPPPPVFDEDSSIYDLPEVPDDDEHPPLDPADSMDSMDHIDPIEHASTWHRSYNSNQQWTTPLDIFDELKSPIVRPEMLPECIREWMHDTSEIKGVDPSILALSAVVSCAALLHDSIQIQPEINNPSWRESARLWGAIVGGSASGKTPAINAAMSRLKKIQIDLSAHAERLEDDYKAQEMAFDMQRKNYIKKLSEADPTAVKPVKPPLPEISRLLIQDVTVDKLADLLKSCTRGCIVDKPELAGWFGSMDAYKNGAGGSDRAAWLTFFDGGPLYVDRIGRGSLFVPNFGGSIIGAIQPDAFSRIVEKLPEDGLLQRFLIVNARQQVEGNEKPYNKAANDRFHEMQQRIFDTLVQHNHITLSHEANEVRREITGWAFSLMRINFVSSAMCSHLGKYQSLTARLMLTFHAIECADRRIHPQSCQISGETARMVHLFIKEFLFPHAMAFYINLVGQSEIGKHLRKLGELCLTCGAGEITNRDFLHGWIGWRHCKPYDQETVIGQLIDNGWILPAPGARTNAKGFPTRFLINPEIHELHAERKAMEIERRKLAVEAIELAKIAARKGQRGPKARGEVKKDADDDF